MSWQTIRDHLYLTRARAIALGFTHEGTLFGVPAWMRDVDGDPARDPIIACPKVPLLQLWAMLADAAYASATWFMFEDQVLPIPIRVLGKIPAEAAA
ncbi:MAG TPA: hypothetical protein VGE09_11155 [Pseudoxanthomonas sp.]